MKLKNPNKVTFQLFPHCCNPFYRLKTNRGYYKYTEIWRLKINIGKKV